MTAGTSDPAAAADPAGGAGTDQPLPVVLPAAVRDRVVGLAAERLGTLPPEDVPAALRPFRRFTPAKRARLAAVPLAAALERDPGFRSAVARGACEAVPDLGEALADGQPLPAAPPEDVAALAYLLRPEGWPELVATAGEELAARQRALAGAATVDAVARLTDQLAAVRATARAEAQRLGAQADAARHEAAALRRQVRDLGERAARAERAAQAALAESALLRGAVPAGAPSDEPPGGLDGAGPGTAEQPDTSAGALPLEAEVRRLRTRLARAEAALATARTAGREDRYGQELRLRVLLDALLGAAGGLRRELALPPVDARPADAVAAELTPAVVAATAPRQGRSDDDPFLLDALLGVPAVHLLVDGYNVTKTGYGDTPLESQRARLLAGLAGLAARTGAETTVVFDGVDRATPVAVAGPRGVRLLFSRTGETADEVLHRLVAAEPSGRPLVVVSSDREVADAARQAGAQPVQSAALLRLLER